MILLSDISLWSEFINLSGKDVWKLIKSSKKKSCILDPFPTSLLIDCPDFILSVITKVIGTSLQSGYFLDLWKTEVVNPLLEKAGLDRAFKNYRPVSNLLLINFKSIMSSNGLFALLQSAFQKNHSTETALLEVKNDHLMNNI